MKRLGSRPLRVGVRRGNLAASLKRPDVLLGLFIALGLLGSPLYNTALVRSQLIGDAAVGPHGSVAVLCAGLALAWRATLRRGHVWADPASLTWADFDGGRSRELRRRVGAGWATRFATAADLDGHRERVLRRRLLAGWATRFATTADLDYRRENALHRRLLARRATRFATVTDSDGRREGPLHRRLLAGWATRFATVTDSDSHRERVLRRRLLAGWATRFATVAYFFVVAGVLIGFPPDVVGPLALSVAVAALALVTARRRPLCGEAVLPLAPAVLGVFPDTPLWIFAAVAAAAAFLLAWSPPLSPRRDTLVRHFRERLVRRTSTAFLDVWALLPAGRPVRWRRALDGRFILTRYVVTGTLARRHALGLPVLLALAVTATHTTFPGVTSVWLLGLGSYLALLPFAAPIAQLHRVPGLRRWLDASEPRLRLVMASVLVALAACWTAAVTLLGVPVTLGSLAAVVVAAYSVVRTVTRGPLEFSSMGLVLYEGVLIPTGLLRQLARGPDLLIIGLLLCGLLP
ncbi:hypothetical protein QRX50_08805 [Amycolatopsis carbonis]|uniref:Uncharacterized protein n=1 Tax=Amycolatopsis carbonis TaxID=715471 RepID=A0A9Y2MTM6_9PSEU|nr:hypothetical protein [Amycolatopsis sp. 2-15]WIX80845.1 hypothetical protein QRX50_08805 [Amycolatopsis sp. 2-15]